MTDQADGRCPRCGASVRPDAPWCTLCYADLRPPPPEPVVTAAPTTPDVQVPSTAPAVGDGEFDPLTAPLELVHAGRHRAPDAATGRQPAANDAGAEQPAADEQVKGWPCPECAILVPLADDRCPSCGTGFLSGVDGEPDLAQRMSSRKMSNGTQVMLMAGGSIGLLVLIIGLMFLVGAVL